MFSEKKIFFVRSFWVEIIRLPHSFGFWGCLGRSKRRQFHKNHQISMVSVDLTRILMVPVTFLFTPAEKLSVQSAGLHSETTYRFTFGPVGK